MINPLGPRHQASSGPEDWDGFTPPEVLHAEFEQRQQEWDEAFAALPWWRRTHSQLVSSTSR